MAPRHDTTTVVRLVTTPAPRPAHGMVLDPDRLRLAERIASRLVGRRTADPTTVAAVAVLTTAADPARAERLQPRAGESSPLVERLAVWALPRAHDLAVAAAGRILDGAEDGAGRIAVAPLPIAA